jgi:hypothetical protein
MFSVEAANVKVSPYSYLILEKVISLLLPSEQLKNVRTTLHCGAFA